MSLLLLLSCATVDSAPEPTPTAAPASQTQAVPPPPPAPLPPAPDFEVQPLPVSAEAQQVHREAFDLADGWEYESPAIAVSTTGQIYAVVVAYSQGREVLKLSSGPSPEQLQQQGAVSEGARAWAPVMAAGTDGSVWLAWCGRQAAGDRRTLEREVFVRRVDRPGPIHQVSAGGGRSGNPDLAVDAQGIVHVVWEQDVPGGVGVAYRQVADVPLGEVQQLSMGWMDRRPSVAWSNGHVHVAWDSLVTPAPARAEQLNTPLDPDYDLRFVSYEQGQWGQIRGLTAPGIQAAPDLAISQGELLVAYASSENSPLVKWVSLLKITDSGTFALQDPMSRATPAGEQQGAEFPSLVVLPDGGLMILSRSSQGAYLHRVGPQGFGLPMDLTRYGWGARGQRAQVALSGDQVLAARKARKASVVEVLSYVLQGAPEGWTPLTLSPVTGPVVPAADGHEVLTVGTQKVYLGDVHMHSAMSDATGPADEVIARAWARGLDFATITDHDYVIGARMLPSEHEEQAWLTELFGALPGFTTLHAYEWTTPLLPKGSGHRILYFRGYAPTPILGFKDGAPDTPALNRGLAPERVFSVPHHSSWTGTDWENFDPKIQRHFELVSVHGLSETPGEQIIASRGNMAGMFAVDGLNMGLQFGFMAGSDGHGLVWHHGIARRPDPWTQGLTGVLVESGDRESLWDALYARRTTATSGAPMAAVLWVGQASNGQVTTAQGSVQLHWQTQASRALSEISVVRNGQVVHRVSGGQVPKDGSWTDTPGPGTYSYYLRVVQVQDEWTPDAAWSSPVFVEIQPELQ